MSSEYYLVLAMASEGKNLPKLKYVDTVEWEDCFDSHKNDEFFHEDYYKFKIRKEQKDYIFSLKDLNCLWLKMSAMLQFNEEVGNVFNFANYQKEIFDISTITMEKFEAVIKHDPRGGLDD